MEFRKREPKKKEEGPDLQQKMLNWPDCYYREREPRIRKQLLDEADRQHLTPEDNGMRRKLFTLRYGDGKLTGESVPDNYIKAWIEMRFLSQNGGRCLFSKGPNPKKIRKLFESIGYYDAADQSERNLLYQEFYHLGMLYIALCQEDKQYNTVVLGFGRISEDSQARKIAGEFRTVARYVPEAYHMSEELELFSRAVSDAYRDMFPDYADLLD